MASVAGVSGAGGSIEYSKSANRIWSVEIWKCERCVLHRAGVSWDRHADSSLDAVQDPGQDPNHEAKGRAALDLNSFNSPNPIKAAHPAIPHVNNPRTIGALDIEKPKIFPTAHQDDITATLETSSDVANNIRSSMIMIKVKSFVLNSFFYRILLKINISENKLRCPSKSSLSWMITIHSGSANKVPTRTRRFLSVKYTKWVSSRGISYYKNQTFWRDSNAIRLSSSSPYSRRRNPFISCLSTYPSDSKHGFPTLTISLFKTLGIKLSSSHLFWPIITSRLISSWKISGWIITTVPNTFLTQHSLTTLA